MVMLLMVHHPSRPGFKHGFSPEYSHVLSCSHPLLVFEIRQMSAGSEPELMEKHFGLGKDVRTWLDAGRTGPEHVWFVVVDAECPWHSIAVLGSLHRYQR
ncbi:hypothetical protein ILYODFUR_016252 [Ilyodon furcidens]|uniref:Uncharacterized protein n=1 Tax=Ilyodon furcidens TaxID=33524 RepID=A0ABV0VEH4_9TELE